MVELTQDQRLVIRRLQERDLAAYRAMMLEAYARYPDAFTATPEERADLPLSWWAARVGIGRDAHEFVFGAFVGVQLVGAAGLSLETRPKTRHKATLFGMYVLDDHRGGGAGRALVDAVLDFARQCPHLILIQLTVTEGNMAATRLYERAGFVHFGAEPLAVVYRDGYASKLHMWCDLRA